jgi:hypothetical protein
MGAFRTVPTMWSRIAPLALSIVLATPSVAAAQAVGCDQSECGEVLPSTTTTAPLPTTTSTSVGGEVVVEVPTTQAQAPAGGLPVTGADLVVLSFAGRSAIALGAGMRRRASR